MEIEHFSGDFMKLEVNNDSLTSSLLYRLIYNIQPLENAKSFPKDGVTGNQKVSVIIQLDPKLLIGKKLALFFLINDENRLYKLFSINILHGIIF